MCAPFGAQLYLLDYFTPFAMNPSEAQDAARALARRRHMHKKQRHCEQAQRRVAIQFILCCAQRTKFEL